MSQWILVLLLFSSSAMAADLGKREREREFLAHRQDDSACADHLRERMRDGTLSFQPLMHRRLWRGDVSGVLSADGTAFVALSSGFLAMFIEYTDLSKPNMTKRSRLPVTVGRRNVTFNRILGISEDGKRALVGQGNQQISDFAVVNTETGDLLGGLVEGATLQRLRQTGAQVVQSVEFAISQTGKRIALGFDGTLFQNGEILTFDVIEPPCLECERGYATESFPWAPSVVVEGLAFDGDDRVLHSWTSRDDGGLEIISRSAPTIHVLTADEGERFHLTKQTLESLQQAGSVVLSSRQKSAERRLVRPFQVEDHTNAVAYAGHKRILWNGKASHFRLYTVGGKILFDGEFWFKTDHPTDLKYQVLDLAVRRDGRIVAHVRFGEKGKDEDVLLISDFVVR